MPKEKKREKRGAMLLSKVERRKKKMQLGICVNYIIQHFFFPIFLPN